MKKNHKQPLNLSSALSLTVHRALIFSPLFAVYFTGVISSLFAGKIIGILSPMGWIAFDLKIFFFALLFFEGMGLYLSLTAWKGTLHLDKTGKNRQFAIDYQPQGDAHWAEPVEYHSFAQIRPITKTKGIVVGQLSRDGSECIDFTNAGRTNENIMVIGASGSGKTFSFVQPYIFQAVRQGRSMIITDPKGELYQQQASFLHENGYVIRRLDLITPDKSDGWDPFAYLRRIDPDHLGEVVDVFASTIINNITAGNRENDGVYARGGIALLKAVTLYTLTMYGESANFRYLMLELTGGQELLNKKLGNAASGNERLKAAHLAYMTFASSSQNLGGNIIVHVTTGLQKIQADKIMKILTTDQMDLNLPGQRKCAYFCRFSATDNTYRFITALFFSMSMNTLLQQADRNENRRLKIRTTLLMDEFPSLGVFPGWNEKLSNIRSYGISAVMIIQGIPQLITNYGEMEQKQILGNCSTLINIGCNESISAEELSNRMGQATINTYSRTRHLEAGMNSYGKNTIRETLMSVKDLLEMPEDDMIVIFQHKAPIYCHKTPVTLWPEYRKLKITEDKDIPNISDPEAKRRYYEEEQRLLEHYDALEKINWRSEPDEKEKRTSGNTEDPDEALPVDYAALSLPALTLIVLKADLRKLMNFCWKLKRRKEVKYLEESKVLALPVPSPDLDLSSIEKELEEILGIEEEKKPEEDKTEKNTPEASQKKEQDEGTKEEKDSREEPKEKEKTEPEKAESGETPQTRSPEKSEGKKETASMAEEKKDVPQERVTEKEIGPKEEKVKAIKEPEKDEKTVKKESAPEKSEKKTDPAEAKSAAGPAGPQIESNQGKQEKQERGKSRTHPAGKVYLPRRSRPSKDPE